MNYRIELLHTFKTEVKKLSKKYHNLKVDLNISKNQFLLDLFQKDYSIIALKG